MQSKLSGQCSCGEISYTFSEEPKFSLMCQCRQCQRITGTGHAVQFAVETDKTSIVGNVQTYKLKADSGNDVLSAFCGSCGNPIYKTTSGMPEMIVFHAATLDDPSLLQPQMVVNSDSAQPWDYIVINSPRARVLQTGLSIPPHCQ